MNRFDAHMSTAFCLPTESVVSWAENHITEIPYSPIPGAFRANNSPMIGPILNTIVSPSTSTVVVRAAVQSGKTLAAELALAYIIANDPGPCLWLSTKDDEAKSENESRLRPLFENCPPVKALISPDKNKTRKTSIFFTNGMPLWTLGANNRRNLQSRSIRWLFGDEIWLWQRGRLAEAKARVSAFGRLGKCVFFSQGSFSGDDADRAFCETDAAEWSFACPKCDAVQPFAIENLKWDNVRTDSGERDYQRVHDSVRLVCPHCGTAIENTAWNRARLNASARFVPKKTHAPAHNRGFTWNSLAVMDWGDFAEMYLRAKDEAKKGKIEALINFYQQRLALPWKDETAMDFSADALQKSATENRSAEYVLNYDDWEREGVAAAQQRKFIEKKDFPTQPVPPTATRLRFLSIDVQDGYFVFVVRQWTPSGDSRLITHGILQKIEEIDAERAKWGIAPSLVFIDAGYNTQLVYEYCAEHGAIALQGARTNTSVFRHKDGTEKVFSPRRLIPSRKSRLPAASAFYFSNLSCKDKLKELRDAGTTRWALPADVSKEYLRQMRVERRTLVNGKPMWLNLYKSPNHYFDCEVMQVAAAYLVGLF